jgi:uncharacterized membrane protein
VKNTYSLAILTICVSGTLAVSAQTYRITDLGTLGTNASFATGINASGQVSGYSASGMNVARAWLELGHHAFYRGAIMSHRQSCVLVLRHKV